MHNKEAQMYKHILIPTDGSAPAREAAAHGLSLAKAVGARTTVLTVEPSFISGQIAEYEMRWSVEAVLALKRVADEANAAGVRCETMRMTHNNPHEAILAVATDKGCDIIVIAPRGHGGIVDMILGSVSAKVAAQATVPVLVYH
jgi:nucleotide-binding universal stress UspA family protein